MGKTTNFSQDIRKKKRHSSPHSGVPTPVTTHGALSLGSERQAKPFSSLVSKEVSVSLAQRYNPAGTMATVHRKWADIHSLCIRINYWEAPFVLHVQSWHFSHILSANKFGIPASLIFKFPTQKPATSLRAKAATCVPAANAVLSAGFGDEFECTAWIFTPALTIWRLTATIWVVPHS